MARPSEGERVTPPDGTASLESLARNWLNRNRRAFIRRMETVDVVDAMIEKGSMDTSLDVYEEIATNQSEKKKRARLLLDFLAGQTTKHFKDFITALKETNFPDLASLFNDDEKRLLQPEDFSVLKASPEATKLSASQFRAMPDTLAELLRQKYRQLKATFVYGDTFECKPVSPDNIVVNISLLSTDQLDEHQDYPGHKMRKPFTYPMMCRKGTITLIDLKNIFDKDEAGQVPKRQIATGCSGAGKTTAFTIKAPYEWAKEGNDFWQQFSLFICGSINDTQWRDAKSLDNVFRLDEFDLTPTEKVKVLAYIRQHQDKVLLVVDSLEEAPQPESSSMLWNVLTGKELPNLNVVIASRTCAMTTCLSRHYPFDQRLEVAGFTPEKITRYVEQFFSQDPENAPRLGAELEKRRKVLSLMHTPILASMICKLFQLKKDLPSTHTEVYHNAVLTMLQQSATRLVTGMPASLLDDFPSSLQQAMDNLSKLAFTGLIKKQTMFSHTELGKASCLGLALTLGFLSSATAKVARCENMHSFQHHSMLEFFAAVYAVKQRLRDGERASTATLVKDVGLDGDRSAFWWFVSGLLALRGPMSEHLLKVMTTTFEETKEEDRRRLLLRLLLRCHLECEAKLPEGGSRAVANQIKVFGLDLKNTRLTAMDIRALSSSLHRYHADVEKLSINQCNINGNEMAVLLPGLQKCKRIRELNLAQNKLSMQNMAGVSKVIKQNAEILTHLIVDINEVHDSGMESLAPAIESCSQLEKLDIGDQTMTRSYSANLADMLCHVHCPRLRHLGLSAPLGEDGTARLCEAFKTADIRKSLHRFFLYKPGVSLHVLSPLLPPLSELRTFGLVGHGRDVNDEGLGQLMLSLSKLENLRRVELIDIGLTSQQTAIIVQHLRGMPNMEFCIISCEKTTFLDCRALEDVIKNFPVPVKHDVKSKSESCSLLVYFRENLSTVEGQSPKFVIWFHENQT